MFKTFSALNVRNIYSLHTHKSVLKSFKHVNSLYALEKCDILTVGHVVL
jgi:hypothetical protein